jgi:hypothetical protein
MIPFTCAYWDFLRGKTAFEPVPEHYGIDAAMGEVLKRQVEIEWKAKTK